MLLGDKHVVITGANRGIGKAMLEEFARNGANIFAHSRKETEEFIRTIEEISKKYSVKIYPIYFDLTDYEAMKEAVKQIRSYKVPIDALINNAGVMQNSLFNMTTKDDLHQQFEVNFFSMFIFTQYIVKLMMREKSGSIINMSSIAAFDGYAGQSAYGATKAAVAAMTKSLATELGEYNIRVNAIAPGVIKTDLIDIMSDEVIDKNKNNTVLQRLGHPSEIANTAVFLASEKSSYLTGQIIRVDGGSL